MNKIIFIISGIVVVVLIAGGAIFFTVKGIKSSPKSSPTVQKTAVTYVAVDACSVLTDAVAKQVLGDTAVNGNSTAGNVSTKDASVSNCVYTARIDPAAGVKLSNTKGVSLLARSAKTQAGADTNKSQFGKDKPAGVQDVSGVGDAAFYNPAFGQLNVLKGGNWYIVSNYSGLPSTGTVESDKQLASLLNFK